MRNLILSVCLAFGLSSCATPTIQAANANGGTINGMFKSQAEILRIADDYCKKYGKTGEITGQTGPSDILFACR